MMVVVAASILILFASVCGTVGVAHRSRGGWGQGVAGVRGGNFLGDFQDVGWGRGVFAPYVIVLDRGVSAKFNFQVGLVVEVR